MTDPSQSLRDALSGPCGPRVRRELTASCPLRFAAVYLPHHLTGQHGVSLARFHRDIAAVAAGWRDDAPPLGQRSAWIAPRGSGKSTWAFLCLPLWALAHGRRRFVLAFADTATQAEQHLATYRRELATNELLRTDFPELCDPADVGGSDTTRGRVSRSGAAFLARGIDSSTLGAKLGEQRPDLLLFDDVEPEESNYSLAQKQSRRETILNAVLPMNLNAAVVFVGTTTMPDSIMHDIARTATGYVPPAGEADPCEWVREERITPHYYPAIVTNNDGTESSLWEQKWSLEFLQSIRHTRSFALNFMNDPMGRDGDYWTVDDITVTPYPGGGTTTELCIDPAVTSHTGSDWTGIAVVTHVPAQDRVYVRYAGRARLAGDSLRQRVATLLADYPDTTRIRVETNQGGELWLDYLRGLPVQVTTQHSTAPKHVRFAACLGYYQTGRVHHTQPLPVLVSELVAFPRGRYDDVADATVMGVLALLGRKRVARDTNIRDRH